MRHAVTRSRHAGRHVGRAQGRRALRVGVGHDDGGTDERPRPPGARRHRARWPPPAPPTRAPPRVRAPRRRGRSDTRPCRRARSPIGPSASVPRECSACTRAVPGSRGPAQVPITPWPCRSARSRSSWTCSLDDLGDRAVEQHIERLGVAVEQLGELGAVGTRADPGVPRTGAQRDPDPLEQRLVGDVALDVRRRRSRRSARRCARRRRRRRPTCRRRTDTRGWGRPARRRSRADAGPARRRPADAGARRRTRTG